MRLRRGHRRHSQQVLCRSLQHQLRGRLQCHHRPPLAFPPAAHPCGRAEHAQVRSRSRQVLADDPCERAAPAGRDKLLILLRRGRRGNNVG